MKKESDFSQLSQTIDFLRFPLMVAVVVIHCKYSPWLQPKMFAEMGGGKIYLYFSELLSGVFCSIAVPIFFAISGFLYFHNFELTWNCYFKKSKRRVKSIFIPFFLWNLIYFFIYVLVSPSIVLDEKGLPRGIVPWISDIGTYSVLRNVVLRIIGIFINYNASSAPIDIPFWYLRDLIVMLLIAPIVYMYVKYTKRIGFILLVIVWIFSAKYGSIPFVVPIRAQTIFFIIGAYWAVNKTEIVKYSDKMSYWLFMVYVAAALLDWLTKGYSVNTYAHRISILFGMMVMFKFALYYVRKSNIQFENTIISSIKETSFFLYATHWIFLSLISSPLYYFAIFSGLPSTVIYIIQLPICLLIIVPLGILLNTKYPSIMKVINGR